MCWKEAEKMKRIAIGCSVYFENFDKRLITIIVWNWMKLLIKVIKNIMQSILQFIEKLILNSSTWKGFLIYFLLN